MSQSQSVSLIPLLCLRCQAPLPAEPDEVAWVCPQCGQGLLLSESQGCVTQTINYAAGIPANSKGHPFWVCNGQAAIAQRRVYGGGDQSRPTQQFWGVPHRFFIPAFDLNLDQMVETGTRLLLQPPALQVGSPVTFLPVTLHSQDLQAMAEFIVIGIEASRSDKIREVQFTLQLSPPDLWILP
jgi:predicted RNA-binding Zn-ribbon protein involved in translation (DUF1610 family)